MSTQKVKKAAPAKSGPTTPPTKTAAIEPPSGAGYATLVDKIGHFVAIPQAFVDDHRLSNAAVRLFVLLRSYTNGRTPDVAVFPSYDTILARLGWGSNTTIAAALDDLIKHGWVSRRRRFGKSSRYTLNASPTKSVGLSASPTESVGTRYEKCRTDPTESVEEQDPPEQDPPPTTPVRVKTKMPGAGAGDLKLKDQAERVLVALVANGVSRTSHAQAIAAKIGIYPHVCEVIRAETAAIATDRQIRNRAGALLTRLDRMTADDWIARAPKARRVIRVRENGDE